MSEFLIKYTGYVLFILGAIYSLIKIRYEINKRKEYENLASIRDKRFIIYRSFLSNLDLMNSELYNKQYGEESMKKIFALFEEVKINPYNLSGYYNVMQFQAEILFEWMRKYNKYLDELNELRLVGSLEILSILDDYQNKSKEFLEANAKNIFMHTTSVPGNFDMSVLQSYTDNLMELNNIRRKLELQMRKDIGNE
ncbi:MAG: hypothetical protein HRU80_02285 [Ignavibacteriales bacterium]|nr:MAG: hypothetical protein HRU80_02285 [Ignavibacteriales bacterium]